MNSYKLLFALFFASFFSYSQVKITGVVKDSTQTISFVNVILTNSNGEMTTGTITEENGSFTLNTQQGTYTITVSFLGYQTWEQTISANQNIDLGVIPLKPQDNELDEVVVTSEKPLIERKVDRLIFNVELSSKASSGNAVDVLQVTPGIRVRNNQVSMVGKSNLQTMINGRIVRVSGSELIDYLNSIPSEDIKSIEVISAPPAKYEAQGNSGLINIQLKKPLNDSWKTQLWTYYRQSYYPTGALGGVFNYNKKKVSISLSTSYTDGEYYVSQDDYTYFDDGVWHMSSPYNRDYDTRNLRVDLNYKVNEKWSMGGQFMHSGTNANVTDNPLTNVYDYSTSEIIKKLLSHGFISHDSKINSFNYHNEIVLDTLKRKISFDVDFFKFESNRDQNYEGNIITYPNEEQFYIGYNGNDQIIKNFSISFDTEYPTKFADLSFGGKLSLSQSKNNIGYFNSGLLDSPEYKFELERNDFDYDENVSAFYFSAAKKLTDNLNVKVGARLEYTETNSFSDYLNLDINNDYLKVFPSIYFTYDLNNNSKLSLNYSKRISRPSFNQLNPNMNYINPFQVIEGNVFLQPAFIDNAELIYSYKKLESKVYFSYENNDYSQIPLPDSETNFVRFTNLNYIDRYIYGISENYVFDRLPWWSCVNTANLNYSISKFNLEYKHEDLEGVNVSFSTNNDFYLNSEKTFIFGVNFWYDLPGQDGIFKTKSASSLSLLLKKFYWDKKLGITLRGNDIFKNSATRYKSTINGVYQTARYYSDQQYFQISIDYTFGNNKISSKTHRTGNNEERRRSN